MSSDQPVGISADDALRVMADTAREDGSMTATARGLVAMDRFQRAMDDIRFAPAQEPDSVARLALRLSDFDYSGEGTFDVHDDAIGHWLHMMLAPSELTSTIIATSSPGDPAIRDRFLRLQRDPSPTHLPPFVHTFVPSESPRRRWWQFWLRRKHWPWPTYTFAEVERRHFKRTK